MLNPDFCNYLEYHITRAFANSKEKSIKSLWCDGVLLPSSEQEISKKNIGDKREVVMSAYIGHDGQEKYDLTIKLGNKSLSRYARDLDIKECIPDVNDDSWYEIDTINKRMIIYLL